MAKKPPRRDFCRPRRGGTCRNTREGTDELKTCRYGAGGWPRLPHLLKSRPASVRPPFPPPPRPMKAPKAHWPTVAIVGVGMIGGSIGLALKARKLVGRVIGVGRSATSLAEAKRVHAIDEAATDIGSAIAAADLVVVATGVASIPWILDEVVAAVRPGTPLPSPRPRRPRRGSSQRAAGGIPPGSPRGIPNSGPTSSSTMRRRWPRRCRGSPV